MNSLVLQVRLALKNGLGYSIGIFSLTLGFSVCLLVYRFIQSESRYDMDHPHYENTYRILFHNSPDGIDLGDAVVQFPMTSQLQADFAGIESTLRIYREPDLPLIQFADIKFTESQQLFVDSNFFSFLAFPLISGDRATALRDPNSIVLTQSSAQRYFGDSNPIGQILLYNREHALRVTAVVDETKILSHIKFDMLIPMEFYFNLLKLNGGADIIDGWLATRPWAYIKFKDQDTRQLTEKGLAGFVDRHIPIEFKSSVTLELQPITQIHTHSNYTTEIEPNTSGNYLKIFLVIVVTILFFSSLNFLNLNTSIVLNRAKEFSVKGMLGSSRVDLFREIFTSTFQIAFVSLLVALGLAALLQPYFNLLMEVNMPFFSWSADWKLLSYALALVCLISLIGSIQPFLVIGAGKYVNTISDKRGFSSSVRTVAVGIQIACSFVLIFGTIVIFRQMNYLNDFNLGFKKDNVIVLPFRQSIGDHFESFKTEVKKIKGVENVSWAADAPGLGGVTNYRFVPEGFKIEDPLFMPFIQVDYDFIETMGITMKDGREFDASIPGDTASAYIVNQAFLESVGWSSNYIGKELKMYKPGTKYIGYSGKVVGSFYDFHMESLHFPAKPLILALKHTYTHPGSYLVSTNGTKVEVIDQLKKTWEVFENDWPFEFKLLDTELSRQYKNEGKLSKLTLILSVLAITISLIGLFGMNSIAIVKQYKSIAIKKVLGAHANNISMEVIKKEIIFLCIIFIVAVPSGYFILVNWLSGFEQKIHVSVWMIIQSMFAITTLVLGTIAYHLLKLRNTNPLTHIQKG